MNGPANLPHNIGSAVLCVTGRDTYADDHCESAGLLIACYIVVNFVFNMALLGVLRTSSATVVTLASAFRLPISST